MIKIGVIKEGKVPQDTRVPLIPEHIIQLTAKNPDISVEVASSEIRCYKDGEYQLAGIIPAQNVNNADILLGVKEVPIAQLIEGKTYFFFSHTIKKQPYNRELLRAILKKNITLIDYEVLTSVHGLRIVAFGRWAGLVGGYNALYTYGKKYKAYDLRRAHECFDLEDLKTEFKKIQLPPIRIVVTGGGRAAGGAMEILDGAGIKKVSVDQFLNASFNEAVYVQINPEDYNLHSQAQLFSFDDFVQNPQDYKGNFMRFACKADMLIASAFWHPLAPVLFTKADLQNKDFKIKIIADITCDIEGSIPTTLRATTIDEPLYDYDIKQLKEVAPLSSLDNITVMSIDNLPNELPRDASKEFGAELIKNVLPLFVDGDKDSVLKRATITKGGKLTERYKYLEGFVAGTE